MHPLYPLLELSSRGTSCIGTVHFCINSVGTSPGRSGFEPGKNLSADLQ